MSITAGMFTPNRYFFVWQRPSGRELKETLEYGDHSYIPLGAVSPDEHPGHIFFFESQPFFCNGNGFLCTCSACANMEGDSANLSRHCGVVAVVADSLGQFQARNPPVILFCCKTQSLTWNSNCNVRIFCCRVATESTYI